MATPAELIPTNQTPNGDGGREHYVVCADDDPEFVKSLELFLPERINSGDPDGLEYQFLFFTDPREAIEAVSEIHAGQGVLAMVISDQQMPQMKGTTFLAEIRKQCPDCVCVLLTGHAGLDSAITAINERLLDKYMTKPIENDHDFTVSIQHLLQRFRMQRTIENQHRTIGDLYAFANMLNATEDLQRTLGEIITFTADALACPDASIFLLEGNELVLRASSREVDTDHPVRVPMEPHQIQGLRLARGAMGVDRLEQLTWLEGHGTAAASGLPALPLVHAVLASGDQVLGVILVGGKSPERVLGEKEVETLAYVADTASVAIHNQLQHRALAQAYAETQTQAAALAVANDRLQVLDRLKSDFLTFVCHELRTPLSALAAIDLLTPGTGEQQQAVVIQIVRDGYARLEEFIQRGLEYVGWIATEQTTSWERIDFSSLVREAIGMIPALKEAEVDLEVSYPKDNCLVEGNPADLSDVVCILLDNAIRFSPRKKSIQVAVQIREDRVVLTVSDHGEGFAPAMAEEIFRPFTIADSSHHRTGCALSLAKAASILKVYRGEIRAASEGHERGATFTVTLPRAGTAIRPGDTVASSRAEEKLNPERVG